MIQKSAQTAKSASSDASPPHGPHARRLQARGGLWLLGLISMVVLASTLKATTSVVVPVIFAILIALIMAPLHKRIARALPTRLRWLAHVAMMVLLLGVLALFTGALVFAAQRVLEAMPDVSGKLEELLQGKSQPSNVLGGQLRELWGTLGGSAGGWVVDRATSIAKSIAGMTGLFATATVMVFFLVLLALTERQTWGRKVDALWPGEARSAWSDAIDTIIDRLRRFLVIRTAVGLLQAALYVGWLAVFGVDLLFVWAVVTFVLTYIPNLGSIIAATLPVLYTLITKDFGTAMAAGAGILVIEQVVGNYIDPRLLSRQIVLSPFVILVSMLFWAYMWGAAGAFLATPIMLALLVGFNHVEALRPLALILSNQPTPRDLDEALEQQF